MISLVCMLFVACGGRALSVLFDVPQKQTESAEPRPTAPPAEFVRAQQPEALEDTLRPPIENTLDPDSVRAVLPRDHAGNIDWMAALRDGVIRPRASLPGSPPPQGPSTFGFAFDFFFPGPDTTTDAYFPHSAHTEWAACQQCHPRIFAYRDTPLKMADIFAGKYCAECHGKVAFPVMTGCERCHRKLSMPADRAQPQLIGDIVLKRVTNDSSPAASESASSAARVRSDAFPRARFSHWVHRIRYRCKSCHMELFEPRAGANAITMKDISAGEACGRCHNGETAFSGGFGECHRCHVPNQAPEGAS